jgi:hypothetical protein
MEYRRHNNPGANFAHGHEHKLGILGDAWRQIMRSLFFRERDNACKLEGTVLLWFFAQRLKNSSLKRIEFMMGFRSPTGTQSVAHARGIPPPYSLQDPSLSTLVEKGNFYEETCDPPQLVSRDYVDRAKGPEVVNPAAGR